MSGNHANQSTITAINNWDIKKIRTGIPSPDIK